MTTIFKVGDRIKGKPDNSSMYNFTSYHNGGYGIVTKVFPTGKEIKVKWIGGRYQTSDEHVVESSYFVKAELVKFKNGDYVA